MKYTGTIYRPPLEANTLLLQVSVGCTHNTCSFYTMYHSARFGMEALLYVMDTMDRNLLASTLERSSL